MKTCGNCKIIKEDECFNRRKASIDGLQAFCKECQKQKHQKWQSENLKRHCATHLRYYNRNREKIIAISRQWFLENKERAYAIMRKYRFLHKPYGPKRATRADKKMRRDENVSIFKEFISLSKIKNRE